MTRSLYLDIRDVDSSDVEALREHPCCRDAVTAAEIQHLRPRPQPREKVRLKPQGIVCVCVSDIIAIRGGDAVVAATNDVLGFVRVW
jgi:hypothetical protein